VSSGERNAAVTGVDGAIAWLRPQRGAMERLLERLVLQGSFTRDPDGVNTVVAILAAELARLGLGVHCLRSAAGFGDHLAFETAAPGPRTFLVGHTDTVFPPGTFEGFRVDGDVARGPGVFDMKGGIVVVLFALRALAQGSEVDLLARIPLAGMLVADEEVGSPESQPLISARAAGAACALGFESGRPGDLVVTRRKGTAALVVEAHGVAAHAGNEPEKGRSAIWSLARFTDRAQALSDPARGTSVNVGVVQGGTSKNTVPAHARAEVDLRFETPADGEALVAALGRIALEAAIPGTRIEVAPRGTRPPLARTDASGALAAEYGECQRAAGLGAGEAPLAGGGSDAATTAAAGVPSIDGLGPRGAGYHTPEERIDLGSLVPKAEALVRFLARRAG
jgi:glutamate carboxypeptidase